MRNNLSEGDIKVMAAELSGAVTGLTLNDVETDRTPDAQKINRFYKFFFQQVLTDQPWNFSTKREDLVRISSGTDSYGYPYTYCYDFPSDVYAVWDIYRSGDIDNSEAVTSAFLYPLRDGLQFSDSAEIIGGKVASNHEKISIMYTANTDFSAGDFSPHFVNSLVEVLSLALLRSREAPADTMANIYGQVQNITRKSKSRAALENRKAYSVPRASILNNIDYRMGRITNIGTD